MTNSVDESARTQTRSHEASEVAGKWAPLEPTKAMVDAGQRIGDYPWDEPKALRIYRAMLAAAPDARPQPLVFHFGRGEMVSMLATLDGDTPVLGLGRAVVAGAPGDEATGQGVFWEVLMTFPTVEAARAVKRALPGGAIHEARAGHGTTERPNQPWEAEKASLQSEIEALRGERDTLKARLKKEALWNNQLAVRNAKQAASLIGARGALEPFVKAVGAQSLGKALGHLTREHLREAARVFSALPSVSEGVGEADLRRSQSQPGCAEKAPQLPTTEVSGKEGRN